MSNTMLKVIATEMTALVNALHKSDASHIDNFMTELSEYVLLAKTAEVPVEDQALLEALEGRLSMWYEMRATLGLPREQALLPRRNRP